MGSALVERKEFHVEQWLTNHVASVESITIQNVIVMKDLLEFLVKRLFALEIVLIMVFAPMRIDVSVKMDLRELIVPRNLALTIVI